jgi:putative endonuclease
LASKGDNILMNVKKGMIGENLACDYLLKNGYKILQRNYRSKFGEIDIVALDNKILCFVEVKWRKNSNFGSGLEAISFKKRQKILLTAKEYLVTSKFEGPSRIDVLSIDGEIGEYRLIKNAFLDS